MTRALIAEDELPLAAELREELARLWPELEIVATVHDGPAALQAFAATQPDVLFLDVQMPGLDGLEVARLLGARAHVVFVTAFDHYAVAAFDEGAVDYVLKPLDRSRLARAVLRLKERLGRAPADLAAALAKAQAAAQAQDSTSSGPLRWITVQRGRELRLITVEDVCYFRADNKYVAVVTADSEALITTPLKELMARLDAQVFWQIHRGTVVNVHAIESISRSAMGGSLQLRLKQRSEKLQVSASYAHRFKHM
jgi:DNA-binding LytR/AlgR family response regulator